MRGLHGAWWFVGLLILVVIGVAARMIAGRRDR